MIKKMTGVLTLFALATVAYCQGPKPIGATVRLGFFEPQSKVARDEGGKRWSTFGLDFNVRSLNVAAATPGYKASLAVSVDYAGGGDFSVIPVTLNYVGTMDKWFYSAGVGASINRERDLDGSEVETRTRVRFAYQVGVGYEFRYAQFPLVVQAKYLGSDFEDLNGFAIYVGTRL